jgi:hypothetical protein
MAEKEMYDYLPTLTVASVDYNTARLQVSPTAVLSEPGDKNQTVYQADSGRRVVVTVSSQSEFQVLLQFDHRTLADAGTVFGGYHDDAKAKGQARTFLWDHPVDGHVYVARFGSKLTRDWLAPIPTRQTIRQVTLIIEGKIVDADANLPSTSVAW